MGRIQRIWKLFKTASSEPVPALIGIGIEVAVFSFGDSPKNFKLKCKMGFPFITFVLPLGDMLTIHRPHRERQRSNVKRKLLQMRLRGFIEKGYTDLITQRFPVVKVMVAGEVLNIRVV